MGYDYVGKEILSCGCVIETYEHDFFSSKNEHRTLCQKCADEENKKNQCKILQQKDFDDRVKTFCVSVESLPYEKVPIKYLKKKYAQPVSIIIHVVTLFVATYQTNLK